MQKKLRFLTLFGLLCLTVTQSYALPDANDLGQSIQIYTRFHTIVGKPSWLLIIRDIDHNQNIPYIFDFKKGNNFWIAFTYGRNYLITVSKMEFSPYRSRPYNYRKINNFCHLESNGRIIRGRSLYITIDGNLSPYTNRFTCHVSSYADANFTIAKPESNE